MEVERERALQRQVRKPADKATESFVVEPVPPQNDTGKARDAVGAQLGVSGNTGSGRLILRYMRLGILHYIAILCEICARVF
jgi:hypothetical protein